MIKFDGNIVQFGFGAVGKSFYEKVKNELKFDENKYFVITKYIEEFDEYINLDGIITNFITKEITKDNFQIIFKKYLNNGDLLIDFADTIGTKDICDFCAKNNIMYINTADADWPENWINIFEQNKKVSEIIEKHRNNPLTNKHPIVLQHGNNPGLVSHFVKAGIEYIVNTQYKKNKHLKELVKQNKFNIAAKELGIKMIHVNDIDLQKTNDKYNNDTLVSTWCVDSFLFEMLTDSTFNIGNHENIDSFDDYKVVDLENGFLEFKKVAAEKKCQTYYPNGPFDGFLVPHDETVTIAKSLEVKENNKVIYRPSVMFLYSPCDLAKKYFADAKVNDDFAPNLTKPLDFVNVNEETIIKGYKYPKYAKIVYKEDIISGTEYVGVLLMGEKFNPVWVGNRIELSFLYKKPKGSYYQTPTITPVAISALAAVCWMIKNKNQGGIYFPDDIDNYKYILKFAEKYISKTIYKTINKNILEKELNIDLSSLQAKDFFIN